MTGTPKPITAPGHPVKEGAGYDCSCGECLTLRLPLRWHFGPTETDPYPGSMWCDDCGAEVWCFEDGYICRGCGRQSDE